MSSTRRQTHISASPSMSQLAYFPSDATIVPLTAGGNDLGYSTGLALERRAGNDSFQYRSSITSSTAQVRDKKAILGIDEVVQRFVRIIDRGERAVSSG
ncbi:hypothetical protein MRB53_037281 [Persea americana]|nr:hypothetical protein MRB53_037281 [Persea americana]